ncbi:hypothetical protein BOX15_Mlig017835g2, partial [Macrostomum lignano]
RMSSLVVGGLFLAAVGFGGRFLLSRVKNPQQFAAMLRLPELSKYPPGGFEVKMSKREAARILEVSQTASKNKIKEAHKKIMLLNHPDRGGSPYLASKINEAKDVLEK